MERRYDLFSDQFDGGAPTEPNPSISRLIVKSPHVGLDNNGFAGLNIHRSSRTGKGLLIHMTVEKPPPVDKFPLK